MTNEQPDGIQPNGVEQPTPTGTAQPPVQSPQLGMPLPQPQQAPVNVLAIVSLVLGIVGLFTFGILSVVAVVLGHIALNQIKKRFDRGRGLAIGGLVTGYIGVALWAVLVFLGIILGIGFLAMAGSSGSHIEIGDRDTQATTEDFVREFTTEIAVTGETAIVTDLTGHDEVFWVPGGVSGAAVCQTASSLASDVNNVGGSIVSGTVLDSFRDTGSFGLSTNWQEVAITECGYTADQIDHATDAGEDAVDAYIEANITAG
ncbi:DUF4190 domain-containing protein [Leucobacter sp. 1207-22]|uniref:DUF4190 domain-containing protein n=1 Tax=Leucobacter sp. 1207-22 TaxID=2604456 RepID=UPI0040639083